MNSSPISKNSTTVRLPFPPALLTTPLQWAPFLRRPVLTRLFLSPVTRTPHRGTALGSVVGTVRVGKARVRIRARGNGPIVLLVHGWQGSGQHMRALGDRVVEGGYTAVSFDMPAHGETPGSMTSVLEFSETLSRVAAFFGEVHAIVAHSLGATATALALQSEARWPVTPRAVALISPMVSFDFALDEFARMLGLNESLREAAATGAEERVGITRKEVNLLAFSEPKPPVLLIHDTEDYRVPIASTERLSERWTSACLHRTTGLGHRRILDDPQVGEEVLRALSRSPRRNIDPLDFDCAPEMTA